MSLPYIMISRLAELFKIESLDANLSHCLEVVDRYESSVATVFIQALVVAEDHRSAMHPGIDPIGIIRACAVRMFRGEVQGASTIEQQFVRVVTNKYERTIFRKLREQILALSLSRRRSKKAIASAYLSIAFFGSGCIGLKGLTQEFGENPTNVSYDQALKFVSQMKYPRPQVPSDVWQKRIARRVSVLINRNRHTANNAIQPTLVPRAADGRRYTLKEK